MAAKGRTAKFYAANPEARKKKSAYDKKRNATAAAKNIVQNCRESVERVELWGKEEET